MVHVHQAYEPGRNVLFDITLRVEKGQFVHLRGPNGAGKTTLLKILCGAERPTQGEVRVNGFDLTHLRSRDVAELRRTMGIVFQESKLLPRRTVQQNVAFALEVLGAPAREVAKRTAQVLLLVGLERKASLQPHQLSAGEQQRAGIARAIVNDPVLLLADEPVGNMDEEAAGEILRLFEKINLRGTTVVLASHMRELPGIPAKEQVVLDRGRIVETTLVDGPWEKESEG